jgi:hypothetical protein
VYVPHDGGRRGGRWYSSRGTGPRWIECVVECKNKIIYCPTLFPLSPPVCWILTWMVGGAGFPIQYSKTDDNFQHPPSSAAAMVYDKNISSQTSTNTT